MKCLLIINPKSGKLRIKEKAVDVIEIFNRAGWDVETVVTLYRGNILEIIRKMEGVDVVVCCGGDGTLNEVCDAMHQCGKKLPVGYIPCGTTNDFAGSMGIPLEITDAAEAIVNGKVFKGDIGLFNGRVFVYTASFGMFTEAAYKAPQAVKNTLGSMAYFLEGLKDITNMKGCQMKITMDEEVIEDEFIYGGICNSTTVGGILHLGKDMVDFSDGKMEVILVRMPKNLAELNTAIFDLVNNNFNSTQVKLYHASKICIESEEAIPYTLDGEYGDSLKNVEIQVVPEGIHCILNHTEE